MAEDDNCGIPTAALQNIFIRCINVRGPELTEWDLCDDDDSGGIKLFGDPDDPRSIHLGADKMIMMTASAASGERVDTRRSAWSCEEIEYDPSEPNACAWMAARYARSELYAKFAAAMVGRIPGRFEYDMAVFKPEAVRSLEDGCILVTFWYRIKLINIEDCESK